MKNLIKIAIIGSLALAGAGAVVYLGNPTPKEIKWTDLAYSENPSEIIGSNAKKRKTIADSNTAIEVFQSQYAITNADSNYPQLETWHLYPCVALILDDRTSKTGALAHFDAGRLYNETLNEMLNRLNDLNVNQSNLTARLYGGDIGSARTLAPIVNWLNSKNIPITENDTQPSEIKPVSNRKMSIIYNTKTGEVSNYNEGKPETDYRVDIYDVWPQRKLHKHPLSL